MVSTISEKKSFLMKLFYTIFINFTQYSSILHNIQELKSNSASDNCGKSQPKLSFAQLTHCVKETESTQLQEDTVNPLLRGHSREGTVNQFQEDTGNPVVKRHSQPIVKGTQSRRHSQPIFRET